MKGRSSLIHTILFAVYPVLALLSRNRGQVQIGDALRPLLISLAIMSLLLAVSYLIFRDLSRATIFASLILLTVFLYGHFYDGLKDLGLSGSIIVRHRYLIPSIVILMTLIGWKLVHFESSQQMTLVMTAVGMALVLQSLIQFTLYSLEARSLKSSLSGQPADCSLTNGILQNYPDIYLVILDAYARDDILDKYHGYDNSPFIEELESLGFYVARGSLSNYPHTEMSLASLLNMDYIQAFPDAYSEDSDNREGVVALLNNSKLVQELECLGYSIVAFETGAYWTEWTEAHYYFSDDSNEEGQIRDQILLTGITRFESLLVRNSIGRAYLDLAANLIESESLEAIDGIKERRNRILFALDQLKKVPNLPSPKFVFVHILSPHAPFVFGPNGEETNIADFETDLPENDTVLRAYADQVNFLNSKVVDSVRAVLESSRDEPIIILQGDHGWAGETHEDLLSILNAYYLPDGGDESLYPTITPVNSFRLILGKYFNGGPSLISDASYFSGQEEVFLFETVENTWGK